MIDSKAKVAFWSAVEQCLVAFHDLSPEQACERSASLRKQMENPPVGMSGEMFYHAEPFDVACDIAEEPLKLAGELRKRYDTILRDAFDEATVRFAT